jgi:ubiquinol-cytochrome c reductase cytochrome c1 subunit
MIRIGAFFVGLFFAGWLMVSALIGVYTFISAPPAPTAEHEFHKHPKPLKLSSDGPLGTFDRAQLQRGYQVYKEVCSACHSLKHVALRDLKDLGYDEGQVKALAKEWQVPGTNAQTGESMTRPGKPVDYFPMVYANDTAAAAANNGAIPPDLSLITKARHGGAPYVYSLLTGYQKPDARLQKEFPGSMPGKTTHHNPYFANLNLAMAAPLTADSQVTYAPGNPKPTVDQMSKDVTAFLVWTAEPKMENRKRAGLATLGFLAIFAFLAWGAYQNVWADKKKPVA